MDLTYSFVGFLLQHIIYLVFNCALLVLLCLSAKIPSYYFVLNLVVGSLLSVILLLILGLDYYSIVDIKGPCLCGIQAFSKKLVTGVLSLTVFGISYERVRSLPRVNNTESCCLPAWKVVSFTWGAAGLIAFPQYFAYEYHHEHEHNTDAPHSHHPYDEISFTSDLQNYYNSSSAASSSSSSAACRKTPLLGKVWVKVLYESIVCILFHLSPAIYNIYALYQIKFKLKYIFARKALKKTLSPSLYKNLKHIRLAFLYISLFALIWIPYGIVTLWRSFTENPHRIVANANIKSPKRNVQKYLEGAFMTLHPVMYLYTHHHSRFTSFCKIFRLKRSQENENNDEILAVSTIPLETFQPSG